MENPQCGDGQGLWSGDGKGHHHSRGEEDGGVRG